MRRIKEILRLKYELGLGQRQIARSCSIGQSTVHDYLRRACSTARQSSNDSFEVLTTAFMMLAMMSLRVK